MYEKKCACCGRTYTAKTSRSKYCCNACRSLDHYRKKRDAEKYGRHIKRVPQTPIYISVPKVEEPMPIPTSITKESVAHGVTALRGDAAFFDAAAQRGPVDYRDVCGEISRGVLNVLGYGL